MKIKFYDVHLCFALVMVNWFAFMPFSLMIFSFELRFIAMTFKLKWDELAETEEKNYYFVNVKRTELKMPCELFMLYYDKLIDLLWLCCDFYCEQAVKKKTLNWKSFSSFQVTFLLMPLEIGWAYTVQWLAGDIACRFMMFFRTFGLYLSSFVLVCISVDRLVFRTKTPTV